MKKALVVGINKFQDPAAELRGCVNDAKNLVEILMARGWEHKNIRMLCDERATKEAILTRLAWLVKGAKAGDSLFFSFSGHGAQVRDRDGDELSDSLDEILCPYDFPKQWDTPLSDDVISGYLKKLPKTAKFTMLIDACHSGTVDRGLFRVKYQKAKQVVPPPDIQFRAESDDDLKTTIFGACKLPTVVKEADPDVHLIDAMNSHLLLSGCRDDQTSADAVFKGIPQGAMTWAFKTVLAANPDVVWGDLHRRMRDLLETKGYSQVPQLTCSLAWLLDKVLS